MAGLTTEIPGLKSNLQLIVGTAQPAIGGSYVRIAQSIEGYRFSRAAWGTGAAAPVTIGFWARSALAGGYQMLLINFDGSAQSAWVPFTLTAPGLFQWVTVTIPAVTTGTWKSDNSTGATIIFNVCSAATPNLMATSGNYFGLTGVVVLPGTQAPTAAQSPLIMRPYDQELATCKRYWQKLGGDTTADVFLGGYCPAAGQLVAGTLTYPVEMRALPTAAIAGVWNSTGANLASTTLLAGKKSLGLQLVSATTSGPLFVHTVDASTYISLDARL
jgi:hypothetical protein